MASIHWRGTFDLNTAYQPGDAVYFPDNGFTYICLEETRGIPPFVEGSGFELMAGFDIDIIDGGRF
jgi:hypothetical protein